MHVFSDPPPTRDEQKSTGAPDPFRSASSTCSVHMHTFVYPVRPCLYGLQTATMCWGRGGAGSPPPSSSTWLVYGWAQQHWGTCGWIGNSAPAATGDQVQCCLNSLGYCKTLTHAHDAYVCGNPVDRDACVRVYISAHTSRHRLTMYALIHLRLHPNTHTHKHIRTLIRTHTYTHVHTHPHTHTYTPNTKKQVFARHT